MVFNSQNVTSACVLLWAVTLYFITGKPLACALGHAFIQLVMAVFVFDRLEGEGLPDALLDVALISTFALGYFLLLDQLADRDRTRKFVLVVGALLALAGNFVLIPILKDHIHASTFANTAQVMSPVPSGGRRFLASTPSALRLASVRALSTPEVYSPASPG